MVTGRAYGLVLPSYAEFTGYFLAASTFLAGAYTLNAGGHIRVALLIQNLGPASRRMVELWCAGTGAVFAVYFTWWSLLLTLESWEFNDVSPGIVPVPIWLPQSAMSVGLVILSIALLDRFHRVLTGAPVGPDTGEP
jgi:TRAP-type C4-dicarboxylate transport system permease small subunit